MGSCVIDLVDSDVVSVEEILFDTRLCHPELVRRCLYLCRSNKYGKITPASLQIYSKIGEILFADSSGPDPRYGVNVIIACSIAWMSVGSWEWENDIDLLFELVIYGVHLLNRVPDYEYSLDALEEILKAAIKNPVQGDRGSIVLIHEVFAALGKSDDHSLTASFLVHYFKNYCKDGYLMMVLQAPWKLASKLAKKDALSSERVGLLLGISITVIIEILCRRGIRAADEKVNAILGIFRAMCNLWESNEKFDPTKPHCYEMVSLLSLILCRADELSLIQAFGTLTLNCCQMLLRRPMDFVEQIKSFIFKTSSFCAWIEDLNEDVTHMVTHLVLFLWKNRSLVGQLTHPVFLQLLFYSIPHAVNLLEVPAFLDQILINVVKMVVTSAKIAQELALVEEVIFGNFFSRHPMIHSFSMDVWSLLLFLSSEELRARYCEMLLGFLGKLENVLYPDCSTSIWNSEKNHMKNTLALVIHRMQNVAGSSLNGAFSRFISFSTSSKPMPLKSMQYWLEILPLGGVQFDVKYHQVLGATVSQLEAEPLKSFERCHTHVFFALGVVGKLLDAFHCKFSPKPLNSLEKLIWRIIDEAPRIHGLLLDYLAKIVLSINSNRAKLVCRFSSLLEKTDTIGKIVVSRMIRDVFLATTPEQRTAINLEMRIVECIELLLGEKNWILIACTLKDIELYRLSSPSINDLYAGPMQKIHTSPNFKSPTNVLLLKNQLNALSHNSLAASDLSKARNSIQKMSFHINNQETLELMNRAYKSLLDLEKNLAAK